MAHCGRRDLALWSTITVVLVFGIRSTVQAQWRLVLASPKELVQRSHGVIHPSSFYAPNQFGAVGLRPFLVEAPAGFVVRKEAFGNTPVGCLYPPKLPASHAGDSTNFREEPLCELKC